MRTDFAMSCYNVGGGVSNSLSLVETTALCREITGQKKEIGSVPENRSADVRIDVTDSRRVSSINGLYPCYDAHKTLTDIHEWLRKSGETKSGETLRLFYAVDSNRARMLTRGIGPNLITAWFTTIDGY